MPAKLSNVIKSKMISEVSMMPPLRHWVGKPEIPFDIEKSEVCDWIMRQPWFRQWIFQKAMDTGAIVFHKESGKWQGAMYGVTHSDPENTGHSPS